MGSPYSLNIVCSPKCFFFCAPLSQHRGTVQLKTDVWNQPLPGGSLFFFWTRLNGQRGHYTVPPNVSLTELTTRNLRADLSRVSLCAEQWAINRFPCLSRWLGCSRVSPNQILTDGVFSFGLGRYRERKWGAFTDRGGGGWVMAADICQY